MCIIKQTEEVATFSKTVSIITALCLLIVVMFYAGLRYHTEKDYKSLFAGQTGDEEVTFPAITICPLTSAAPALQQNYYMARTFPSTDVPPTEPTVISKSLLYRGDVVNCLQYNSDMANFNSASSPQSGLVIRFGQNVTNANPFTMTGAVGILHDQNQEPVFQDPPMFYAPLGQTTQVSVLNYYVRNTKRELTDHFYVAVPALTSTHVSGANADIAQVIIAYNQFGYYIQSQYHVYTTWMWIGEVGGAAALIYFLQHGLLWVMIGCARRTCFRKERRIRKDAELASEIQKEEQDSNEAAVQAALAEDAAANNTTTKPRRKRRQQPVNGTEAEMEEYATSSAPTKPKSPKNNRSKRQESPDRVVIDMDSLAEDSD